MHQQLWGYKVEEKLYLGVREQNRLNVIVTHHGQNPLESTKITVSERNSVCLALTELKGLNRAR
jgi:predicted SPOUT superfamily RNA methylase MTH1